MNTIEDKRIVKVFITEFTKRNPGRTIFSNDFNTWLETRYGFYIIHKLVGKFEKLHVYEYGISLKINVTDPNKKLLFDIKYS